jgi:hypothetical protein
MHSKPILLRSRRLPLIVAKILPISRSWVTARAPEPEACHLAGRATVQARRMYTHPHRPTFLSRRLQVRHLRSVHRHMLHLPSTIVGDEVDQRLLLTRPLPRHSTSPHPAILQRVRDTLPHHHLSLQLRLVIAHNPHHSARHLPATRQPVRLSVPRPHAVRVYVSLTLFYVLNTPHATDSPSKSCFNLDCFFLTHYSLSPRSLL